MSAFRRTADTTRRCAPSRASQQFSCPTLAICTGLGYKSFIDKNKSFFSTVAISGPRQQAHNLTPQPRVTWRVAPTTLLHPVSGRGTVSYWQGVYAHAVERADEPIFTTRHAERQRGTIISSEATLTERTPTEFRKFYEEWKKTAPANDSDVIPDEPRISASPRHADISDELQGLLFWRNISKEVQPLSTNWMVADNDNNVDKEDDEPRTPARSTECEHVIRPTVNELMSAVEEVEFEIRVYNAKTPTPGANVEYGKEYKACRPLKGDVRPIARFGSIRFATNDSIGESRKMSPTRGSIVGWKAGPNTHGNFLVDTFGSPLGANEEQEDIDSSNEFFADLLNAQPHRYIKGGFCERGPEESSRLATTSPSMTLNEARAFHGLPPVPPKIDPRPALPCGTRRVSDSFIGHKITSGGSPDNPDGNSAEDQIARRQESIHIRAKLSATDVKVLDIAIHASNFEDIGNAFGFRDKTAQRRGKSLLITASRSLSAVLGNVAA